MRRPFKSTYLILLCLFALSACGEDSDGSIPRTDVDSIALDSVGYDPDRSILELEFERGHVYRYYDVPDSVNRGMMAAPSHGHYFNQHIKGKYRYEKMAAVEKEANGEIRVKEPVGVPVTREHRRESVSTGGVLRIVHELNVEEAKQGNAVAQRLLGIRYRKGDGVPQDDAQAVKWYRKSAEQGDTIAQHYLGYMYYSGKGVPQDFTEALKWFNLAAAKGYAGSQYLLGFMYRRGKGVQSDDVHAHMWYNLAASQGHEEAAKWRDLIAGVMSPDQIAEAQKLAREWAVQQDQ